MLPKLPRQSAKERLAREQKDVLKATKKVDKKEDNAKRFSLRKKSDTTNKQ